MNTTTKEKKVKEDDTDAAQWGPRWFNFGHLSGFFLAILIILLLAVGIVTLIGKALGQFAVDLNDMFSNEPVAIVDPVSPVVSVAHPVPNDVDLGFIESELRTASLLVDRTLGVAEGTFDPDVACIHGSDHFEDIQRRRACTLWSATQGGE